MYVCTTLQFFLDRVFFKTTSTKGSKNNLSLIVPDFWKSFGYAVVQYLICNFETKAKMLGPRLRPFFKDIQYVLLVACTLVR